ncbi:MULTISPECIES: response regulator transcription factor [Priestia]|uniref:response regulator transcription factor n=1 Tax=Priestia TaxID=2800373 RepID=UPI001C8E976B|nr:MULTISPECIES: response regulator transcription factor [Priestia]MBY0030505.1 response regulator transcription factor [Priestia aryabhattai]MED3922770.1 response regulator transcription factor [Priestia aryabhattai]MED4001584.1 response regulator transcription factor [Priestia aryabhattai]MED5247519.1 response regulator transcription factor [Priestia sp. LL-8]
MKNMIRVVLIEDDPDWLSIMENIIGKEEDMMLVGCAQTQREGITLSHALSNIDIFLVDINLSGANLDGIYTALELKRSKTSKVIMLTSLSDEEVIQQAFTAGATNYILKKDAVRIPEIIRSTYHTETNPVEVLLKDYRRMKTEEQLKDLTNAEREVFEYIEKGYSRKKITLETHKSDNTLKTHFKNIFKKLSVSNTKDLINKVKTGGLK